MSWSVLIFFKCPAFISFNIFSSGCIDFYFRKLISCGIISNVRMTMITFLNYVWIDNFTYDWKCWNNILADWSGFLDVDMTFLRYDFDYLRHDFVLQHKYSSMMKWFELLTLQGKREQFLKVINFVAIPTLKSYVSHVNADQPNVSQSHVTGCCAPIGIPQWPLSCSIKTFSRLSELIIPSIVQTRLLSRCGCNSVLICC